MSQAQFSYEHQATASCTFPRFQSLPRELQLLVFEYVVYAAQKPRIVLLDVEECQLFHWDSHLLGWRVRVDNREQLHAENPAAVARSLLGINSTSRYVATRFLGGIDDETDTPHHTEALMALGLSLVREVFWLPDDLPRFLSAREGPPAVLGPTDDHQIESIMVSLHVFEEALHWAGQRWEDHEEVSETAQRLGLVLRGVLECFPGSWNLVVAADVARSHVSWDQIQAVGANDPALLGLGNGQVTARCLAACEKYEVLHSDLMQEYAWEQAGSGYGGDDFSDWEQWTRVWPQLSFAFLRS